jgi:hypothetical protein
VRRSLRYLYWAAFLVAPRHRWKGDIDCTRRTYYLVPRHVGKLIRTVLPDSLGMLISQCQLIAEIAVSLQQRLNWEYGDPQVVRPLANYRIYNPTPIHKMIRGRLRRFWDSRFSAEHALNLAYWRRKQDIIYMAEPNPKVLGGIPNRLYHQWQLTHPLAKYYY